LTALSEKIRSPSPLSCPNSPFTPVSTVKSRATQTFVYGRERPLFSLTSFRNLNLSFPLSQCFEVPSPDSPLSATCSRCASSQIHFPPLTTAARVGCFCNAPQISTAAKGPPKLALPATFPPIHLPWDGVLLYTPTQLTGPPFLRYCHCPATNAISGPPPAVDSLSPPPTRDPHEFNTPPRQIYTTPSPHLRFSSGQFMTPSSPDRCSSSWFRD